MALRMDSNWSYRAHGDGHVLAVVVDTDIADRTIGFCIAGIFGPDEVMTVSSAGRHRLWLEKDSSEDSCLRPRHQ